MFFLEGQPSFTAQSCSRVQKYHRQRLYTLDNAADASAIPGGAKSKHRPIRGIPCPLLAHLAQVLNLIQSPNAEDPLPLLYLIPAQHTAETFLFPIILLLIGAETLAGVETALFAVTEDTGVVFGLPLLGSLQPNVERRILAPYCQPAPNFLLAADAAKVKFQPDPIPDPDPNLDPDRDPLSKPRA